MTRLTAIWTPAVVVAAGLVGSPVAQANPMTPTSVIESSATELCGAIDRSPTARGALAAMAGLQNSGLDEIDGALVLITAIHHVCPQHEELLMDVLGPAAQEEICERPTRWTVLQTSSTGVNDEYQR